MGTQEPIRARVRNIIFDHDTPAGRGFDIVLLWCIIISVITVILESVATIRESIGPWLRLIEWTFTVLFAVEYVLRLWTVQRPVRYAFSFFGMIDLLAVLPTILSLIWPEAEFFLIIRIIRFLRVFRVLKLVQFLGEAQVLLGALRASLPKITVFLGTVLTVVTIVGALMFVIEGPANGFTNIPVSMYWAIVTLTTVGYGDITPLTMAGKFVAAVLMLLGYGIIAVPTGIVSAELARSAIKAQSPTAFACPGCGREGHDQDADFCKHCGGPLAAAKE